MAITTPQSSFKMEPEAAAVPKQGLLLAAAGGLVGLVGVFGLNRLIASLLFGVQPTHAAT